MDEEPSISEAAQREADSGYGIKAFGPTIQMPTPPRAKPMAFASDLDIAEALGANGQQMGTASFEYQKRQYREQQAEQQRAAYSADAHSYSSYLRALEKQQERMDKMATEQAKIMDPFTRAQRMYTMAGSLGGARTIAKSTGAALFQHGEVVDLGGGYAFRVAPMGAVRRINPQNGQEETISLSQSIAEAGVTVVPFLGGDEDAKGFRRATSMANDVITKLTQIEELARSPGAHSLYGTDTRDMLKQLEAGLAQSVSQIRSGSKSMAGISDKEMDAIAAGIPEASALFSRDKTAITKADMTKRQLINLIIRQAQANGVELNLINTTKVEGKKASQGSTNTIPGLNLSPNGQSAGPHSTAQPR